MDIHDRLYVWAGVLGALSIGTVMLIGPWVLVPLCVAMALCIYDLHLLWKEDEDN